MLLHHFGSKEKLIAAVMQRLNAQLQATFSQIAARNAGSSDNLIFDFWNTLLSKAQLPRLRLLLEVQVLAIQNPKRYRRYLSDTSDSWQELIRATLPAGAKDRTAFATLATAVIDGLLLEYLATGDRRRTSNALKLFIQFYAQSDPVGEEETESHGHS